MATRSKKAAPARKPASLVDRAKARVAEIEAEIEAEKKKAAADDEGHHELLMDLFDKAGIREQVEGSQKARRECLEAHKKRVDDLRAKKARAQAVIDFAADS